MRLELEAHIPILPYNNVFSLLFMELRWLTSGIIEGEELEEAKSTVWGKQEITDS